MSAYLNQFKRRIAHQKGLDSKKTPGDEYGTKALMKIWGLSGEQPQNIFYRNRNEYDSIWFLSVWDDPEIGESIRKKINAIVSAKLQDKPDLNVWDMSGTKVVGTPNETFESVDWIVTFEKSTDVTYMRIYHKG